MPRKPSSILVIEEVSTLTTNLGALGPSEQMPTTLRGVRIPLADGQEPKDAAERYYPSAELGSRLWLVEDTKAEAFTVGLKLEPIEDPRLKGDDEEEDK